MSQQASCHFAFINEERGDLLTLLFTLHLPLSKAALLLAISKECMLNCTPTFFLFHPVAPSLSSERTIEMQKLDLASQPFHYRRRKL